MQSPAAARGMFLLVVTVVLAVGSASAATVAPVEFSIIDYVSSLRMTYYQDGKPVHSVTAAGFLDYYGIERTPSDERVFTVTVDQSGNGNYTRIQDAINAVPIPGSWTGTSSEKVVVNKSKISLVGMSASSTIVTWSGNWTSDESATLSVLASDFVARNITFQNTYGPGAPALAARVAGDRAAFYGCRFVSYQDTILDDKGLHYYSDCYVQSATDFIFGPGKAFFEQQGASVDTSCMGTAFFGQFQCYGEGSRTGDRVRWSHNHLSPAEAKPFLTKEAWVDGKDWIK
ncbi:putative pectinesterase 11 [Panicum miliaceum]|uniref:pectinesterase n=1 Tax=Panicum miliaceum TaxID=4540 RepID=A0A3L6SHM6_PANMI|nr:putative pectinesterase 11 [Panicum miliaceum]